MKYLSKLSRSLKSYLIKGYVRKRPKHEPTDSYFYLARYIAKCMMISDALNFHVEPVNTEMTGMKHILTSHVCDLDESK